MATLLEEYGEKQDPLVKKSDLYFIKAQIVHEVKGAVEAVMHDKGSQNSCLQTEGLQNSQDSQKSCVRAEGLQIHKSHMCAS